MEKGVEVEEKRMEIKEKYQKVQAVVSLTEFQVQLFCNEPRLVSWLVFLVSMHAHLTMATAFLPTYRPWELRTLRFSLTTMVLQDFK